MILIIYCIVYGQKQQEAQSIDRFTNSYGQFKNTLSLKTVTYMEIKEKMQIYCWQ